MRPILRLAAVGLLLSSLPASVRADAMDKSLIAEAAPKILDAVQKRGWKNFGILKFEVQRGGDKGPVSMTAGNLNTQMATRLENALILKTTDDSPIGIVRAPGEIAAKRDLKAGYHTEAARLALLGHKYPLAWGDSSVDVDGFVTGRVILGDDFKKATVVLRAFGSDDLKLKEIARFETPVERSLLVDVNQPFAAPMALIRKRLLLINPGPGGAPPPIEDIVLEDAQKSAKTADEGTQLKKAEPRIAVQSPPAQFGEVKKELDRLLTFEVVYDGKVVDWTAANRLPPPEPGQKIEFRLKSTEPLGVVLRVNGVNTADGDKEERPTQDYSTWVLTPNVSYTVRGFYGKDNVSLFKAEKRDDVDMSELGNERRIGKIDLDVFQVPPANVPVAANNPPPANLRERGMAANLPELRGQLRTLSSRKVVVQPRQLILLGEKEAAKVQVVEFTGVHTIHLPIVYFDPRAATPTFLQPENE